MRLLPELVVAVALLPFIHLVYTAWVRRRHPLTGDVFMFAGRRLHYLRFGSGPAVVLVHGANGTWNDFPTELIADLSRDHTVIALDRPGHGWSQAPSGPLGLRENAAAITALVRELGLGPATLVGHSYGAAVALRAALDAPGDVSQVIAVCPCTAIDKRNARYGSVPLMHGPFGALVLQFIALPMLPFALPLRAEAWYPEPAPPGWGASRAFAYVPSQMHASVRNFHQLHADVAWLHDQLPRLSMPLTVLAGAQDLVTPVAHHLGWLQRALPAARIQVVPGTGHWLPRLHPEMVSAAVRAQSGTAGGR